MCIARRLHLQLNAGHPLIYGTNRQFSPDQTKLVFRPGKVPLYGSVPPELESDQVQLTLVGSQGNASSTWTIYPELSRGPQVERKRFRDLNERHLLKSEFAWSPDSQMLAFVEWHQRVLSLVVLAVAVKKGELEVAPKKFKLTERMADVKGLAWLTEDRAIKVETVEATYLIHLRQGTIRPVELRQESRITPRLPTAGHRAFAKTMGESELLRTKRGRSTPAGHWYQTPLLVRFRSKRAE